MIGLTKLHGVSVGRLSTFNGVSTLQYWLGVGLSSEGGISPEPTVVDPEDPESSVDPEDPESSAEPEIPARTVVIEDATGGIANMSGTYVETLVTYNSRPVWRLDPNRIARWSYAFGGQWTLVYVASLAYIYGGSSEIPASTGWQAAPV